MSEDISPAKMKCEYDTDAYIPKESTVAEKQTQYGFHIQNKHSQAVGGLTTEDSCRKVKFPQPGIDQGNLWNMEDMPHTVGGVQEADAGLD